MSGGPVMIGLKSALYLYALIFNGVEFKEVAIDADFASEKRCMEVQAKVMKRMEKVDRVGEWLILEFNAICDKPEEKDEGKT